MMLVSPLVPCKKIPAFGLIPATANDMPNHHFVTEDVGKKSGRLVNLCLDLNEVHLPAFTA